MSFWGLILKAGQKVPVESADGDILHLSQACLHNPKSGGKNYLQVTDNEKTYTIACLEKDKAEHASFDLFFSTGSCSFSSKGDTEVHLTGYFEPSQDMGEESEEEDEAPPPAKKSPAAAPAKSPLAKPASPAAAPAKSPKLQAKAPVEEESDDDDDDEEEEDEMDMDEDEEAEDEEGEESEEEEAPPAKKRKTEEAPKKSSGSPAGKPAAAPAGVDAYIKQVQDFLKKNGKSKISFVGSKVARPKDAPKLKQILEQNKDKFSLSGEDVELKK